MAAPDTSPADATPAMDVHQQIGALTRQLHDSLNGLGLTAKVQNWAGELPDAKSRLSYIARLTGEAAEKVLSRVDLAKIQHDFIAAETSKLAAFIVKDPVAAVATGAVYNFVADVERASKEIDMHLTEIMMAQDFHDLTGQVITRVVNLTSTIEKQLIELLIQTAPSPAPVQPKAPEGLAGPVVDAGNRTDVVTDQSQVDDLLASLGF